MAGAHRLIAVTDIERQQLRQLGASADSIVVIPNPIDLSEFDPPPERGRFRERLALGARPVVLFLGKLTPRKRLDVLVDAFARLEHADAALVIAGNDLGAGRAIRTRVQRRRLEHRTFFPGLLKGRERLNALADADVAVYPARDEIFGLVPLEAILAGTPVIVADDSGCAEVIARTGGGRIVTEGDVSALASQIRLTLADPEAARGDAAKARERVSSVYATDQICGLIEGLYTTVLRDARSQPDLERVT
jgi:glycosyltransferase involved in cell wall biosynthesis